MALAIASTWIFPLLFFRFPHSAQDWEWCGWNAEDPSSDCLQHEWELSHRDFSPTGAGRFRHLLGKFSREVSNLGFFVNAKCLATLRDCIQVYSCFSEGASNLFRGRIVSPAQSPFVQLLNVSEFASDLCTREARLPPIPNAGETALLSLSHLIPGAVFCLTPTEKRENSTQSPAASGSGLGSCLLLSLTETNSKAFTVNNTSWGSAWSWQFFLKKKKFLFKNMALSLFLWTTINLKDWKIIWTSTPRTILLSQGIWNLLVDCLQGHNVLYLLMIQIQGQMSLGAVGGEQYVSRASHPKVGN